LTDRFGWTWLLRNPQVAWTCHWRWGKFIWVWINTY
jgi:hypothetical protein